MIQIVAVGNGTQALHLALAAINANHNDEVLSQTFHGSQVHLVF